MITTRYAMHSFRKSHIKSTRLFLAINNTIAGTAENCPGDTAPVAQRDTKSRTYVTIGSHNIATG